MRLYTSIEILWVIARKLSGGNRKIRNHVIIHHNKSNFKRVLFSFASTDPDRFFSKDILFGKNGTIQAMKLSPLADAAKMKEVLKRLEEVLNHQSPA